MASRDITYCSQDCPETDCPRNTSGFPFELFWQADLEGTEYCLKYRKGREKDEQRNSI